MARTQSSSPPARAPEPLHQDLDGVLQRLARLQNGKHWVVSAYVRLSPEERLRGRYMRLLKARARAVAASLDRRPLSQDARATIARELDRMLRAVEQNAGNARTQGLAVFSCQPANLLIVVAIPEVHRTRVLVDRSAHVRELLELDAEFGRILAAVIDRQHARFFEVGPLGAEELPSLRGTAMRGARFHTDRQGAPGWSEHEYHHRVERDRERHFAEILAELRELDRTRRARGFVLTGPASEIKRLEHFLDAGFRQRLVGIAGLTPKTATAATVFEAVSGLRAEAQRAAARAEAGNLESLEGQGWAVRGLDRSLKALSRGQLRTLVVVSGVERPGARCVQSGRLVSDPGQCRSEGGAVEVTDVVDDAVEEALRQGVRVVVVPTDSGAATGDGLAGVLRYR